MRARSFWFGIAGMAGLATAASATGAAIDWIDWPNSGGGFGSAPFGGSAVARLSGDDIPDLAVIRDGELHVFDQVASYTAFSTIALSGTANDVAALTVDGQAPASDRDRLIVAASDGLWMVSETSTGHTFTPIDLTPNWQGLKRVITTDLDNDGDADLLVLRADSRTIDAKIQRPNGTFLDTARFSYTAASDVLDLMTGELDALVAEPELIVNDQAGLRVLTGGGGTLAFHASVRPDLDRVALVKRDETTSIVDRIVWVTAAGPVPQDSTRHLFSLDLATITTCFTTTEDLDSVASGRFDDDSASDLVFCQNGEVKALFLFQQTSSAPLFDLSDPAHYQVEMLGGTATYPSARVCVGDFDGDRVEDVVIPVASLDKISLISAPVKYASVVTPNDFLRPPDFCGVQLANPDAQRITVAATLTNATALGGLVNSPWRVQFIVMSHVPGSSTYPVVHYCRKPINDVLIGTDTVELDLTVNPKSIEWFVLVRLVRVGLDANNNEVALEVLPQIIGCYSSVEAIPESYEALGAPGWPAYEGINACGTTSRIGGFIRIRRMPVTAPPPPPEPPTGSSCS